MFAEDNPTLEKILGEDSSEKALTLKNHINLSVENYLASQWDVTNTRYLNNQYWNLLGYLVKRRVAEMRCNSGLSFGKPERLAVDFGYVSSKLVKSIPDFREEAIEEMLISKIPEDVPLRFYSVSTWLSFKLREFDGTSMFRKLKKQYDTSVFDIDILRKDIEMSLKSKRALIENLKPAFTSEMDPFNKFMALTDSIEKASDRYALIKFKIQAGYALKKDERSEFVNIENSINNARSDRKRIFKTFASAGDIRNLFELSTIEESIIQKEREMFELVSTTGKQNSYINRLLDSQKVISNKQREEFLTDRVSALKGAVNLFSKREKKDPALFLTMRPVKGVPEKYASAIGKVLGADRFIFYNKEIAAHGYPSVIFIPGTGLATYDSAHNAFFFSQFPEEGEFEEAVLKAFGSYRWNYDEESKLRASFSTLKANSELPGGGLEQSFIRNYCAYIRVELGRAKKQDIDREIKNWLSWQIFARKDQAGEPDIPETSKSAESKKAYSRHPSGIDFEEFEKIMNEKSQASSDEDGEIVDIQQIIKSSPLRNTIIELLNEEAGGTAPGKEEAEEKVEAEKAAPEKKSEAPSLNKQPDGGGVHERVLIEVTGHEVPGKNIKALYEKIESIFKAQNIEKRVTIANSSEDGKVDISISGVEIRDLNHLLNLLSIQMKTFGLLGDMIRKN